MRHGQEATPVAEIPQHLKPEHANRLHQAMQGGGRRLLVRRGPVWIRVLLW